MADNNYEIDVTLEETFGTGVRSVEQTATSAESGGMNEITVTLTNDQENKFYIMNGLAGKDGRDGGFPVAVGEASLMTDTSKIYLYVGIEEGYTQNHLYYWDGEAWHDYGTYGAPADYLRSASVTHEQGLDQLGNTTYTADTLTIEGNADGVPAETEFVQKLYYSAGENVDGALTQKATSEAIEAAQYLPIVNHPNAPVGDTALSVELQQNVMNVIGGVGYAFTTITMTLATKKAGRVNRYLGRFTTGGNAIAVTWPTGVTVPSALSYKTQTTYDFVIEDSILHVWEDGNAVGDVLDATATANAVSTWLANHPEATTTVADGSITTAKLASGVIDQTLTVSGAAADAKKTGDEISDLKSQISSSQGMSAEFKQALENLLSKVAYIDANGQTYLDALHTAMYPPANLTRIGAVYTQSGTVYDTDTLDSLKADLVITAYYDNGTSEVVSNYVLSGTLAEGTSVITVTYGGKSATFDVTVTEDTEYGTFTPTNVITGSYINTDGSIGTYETSAYSETYYPVKHNVISLGGTGWASLGAYNVRFSLYDSDKNFLRQLRIREMERDSADYHGNPTVIAIPNDAKYFRLSWANDVVLPNPEFTITNLAYTDLFMGIGAIDASTGIDESNDHRIRSDYISVSGTMTFTGCPFASSWGKNGGYAFRCYDSSKAFVGSLLNNDGLFTSDISNVAIPTNTAYVRIFMNHPNGAHYTFVTGWSSEVLHPITVNGTNYRLTEES